MLCFILFNLAHKNNNIKKQNLENIYQWLRIKEIKEGEIILNDQISLKYISIKGIKKSLNE